MSKSCKEISEMLVDYLDGELTAKESVEVTGHLEKCEDCRHLLKGLQKSLHLAKVIWRDGLTGIKAEAIRVTEKRKAIRWRRFAAIAASIMIVTGLGIIINIKVKPESTLLTPADVERRVEEAGNAARLLAAAELLSQCQDGKQMAKSQYEYIIQRYPYTEAAQEAKLRVQ